MAQAVFSPEVRALLKARRWNALGFFFVSFLIPVIAARETEASAVGAGIAISLLALGRVVATPLAARWTDQGAGPRARGILVGSTLRACAYVLFFLAAMTGHFPFVLIATFILGVGAMLFWVPMTSIMTEATAYEHRAEAFGLAFRSDGIGSFVGATIGFTVMGFLRNSGSWQYVSFLFFAAGNIYAGYLALSVVPRIKSAPVLVEDSDSDGYWKTGFFGRVSQLPTLVLVLLGLLFMSALSRESVGPLLQYHLIKVLDLPPDLYALILAPPNFIAMGASPWIGKLIDRRDSVWLLGVAGVTGAIATITLIHLNNPILIGCVFTIDALMGIAGMLILTKAITEAATRNRGTVFAARDGAEGIGGLVGPSLGGFLYERAGQWVPFYASSAIEIGLTYGFYRITRKLFAGFRRESVSSA